MSAPDTVNPSLWRMAQLLMDAGLYEVVPGVYQVRGADLSNLTIVEGEQGITVYDPLISAETARAALDLYYQNRPRKPVVAVIYTHSHLDHAGGVRGVVDEADVKSGKVKIYAPEGFLENFIAENFLRVPQWVAVPPTCMAICLLQDRRAPLPQVSASRHPTVPSPSSPRPTLSPKPVRNGSSTALNTSS